MINKRSRSIILEIFKQTSLKTSDLSKMFKVSERAIRMDLDEIDYFLKCNGFEPLIRHHKKGISFSEANLKTALIYKLINEKDIVKASYTKEERILEILYVLCMRQNALKIDELAASLLVSKSTIVKDLERIKVMLKHEDFQLLGSLDGIQLIGNEACIRKWIVKMFIETMDKYAIIDLIKLIDGKDEITTYKVYWRLFEKIDMNLIKHYVEVMKSMVSAQLSDRAYLHALGNISMMLKRSGIGKELDKEEAGTANKATMLFVDQLYQMMQKDYAISKVEKGYIRYLLYIVSPSLYKMDMGTNQEIESYAHDLVKHMAALHTYVNQDILLHDIQEELNLMVMEDQLLIPIMNHVIELYDESYEDVVLQIKEKIQWLHVQHHVLDKDDYWRIAWHFIANQKQNTAKKKILIVSDKPLSLIKILIRKLSELFDVEIIGICGQAQLEKYISSFDIDCIISTMNVSVDKEVVRVHPLLSEMNISSLKQHLHTHLLPISKRPNETFQEYVYQEDQHDLQDILKHMNLILQDHNVVNLNIYKELNNNVLKQKKDYLIYQNTLILNIRNHEIIKHNFVLKADLQEYIELDGHEIHKIMLIASNSINEYLRFLESIL